MTEDKVLKINPNAQKDIPILNAILQSLEGYEEGIVFTNAEDVSLVRFHYQCDDNLAAKGELLTQAALDQYKREKESATKK